MFGEFRIAKADKEKQMFYMFRQNNSGGVFDFDRTGVRETSEMRRN